MELWTGSEEERLFIFITHTVAERGEAAYRKDIQEPRLTHGFSPQEVSYAGKIVIPPIDVVTGIVRCLIL